MEATLNDGFRNPFQDSNAEGLFWGLVQCGQKGEGIFVRQTIGADLSFHAVIWGTRTVRTSYSLRRYMIFTLS